MLQKFLAWIRERLSKMLSPSSIKQSLHIDVVTTPLMLTETQKWSSMYANQSSWLSGDIKSLNLAATIAARVASTVTLEMKVNISGSPRADYLAEQIKPILASIRKNTEYGLAKGGLIFKPYVKTGGGIAVNVVQADMFHPIAFDSDGVMTSAVFEDHKTIGKNYFVRMEYHALSNGIYQIVNRAYRSSTPFTMNTFNITGVEVPLTSVSDWADIEPEAMIIGIEKPLFAYFKTPFANNIETTSPLGVSIYSRAIDLIEQADRQWSDFLWEFESGKRAVYTTPDAFGKTTDGKPILPDKRLYRLLDLASVQIDKPGFFSDYTPTLREVNILNGLDAILRRIEFNCGLSYGIISDPKSVALTATEIKSQKQEYYVTVSDTQKALEDTLRHLLWAMDTWETAYYKGYGQGVPVGEYNVSFQFDDSVLTDHDAQFTQDQLTVGMQTMPKYVFLMRNYGLSIEDAQKWVADAKAETPSFNFFPQDTQNEPPSKTPAPNETSTTPPAPENQSAAGGIPKNIEAEEGLNGAQITAAVGLLEGVSAGTVAPEVAIQLLISLGLEEARARKMVEASKKIKLPAEAVV